MGKSLQDLGLKDEVMPTAGQDLSDLPEFGQFKIPPQPGTYRFRLPTDMSHIWDVYDTPNMVPDQRIRATFDRDHPLLIVQSKLERYNGEPFETRLSNQERKRGKDASIVASDMDYLLRAFGVKLKPNGNKAYISAVSAHAGKEFTADIRYSWRCSVDRNIRVKDAAGQNAEVENQRGCGNAFYQEDMTQRLPNGDIPNEIQCSCGAVLRGFANLDNYRA